MTNAMPEPQHPVTMPDLLTVKEAASKFRMHPDTIRRLLRDGYLRGVRVGGQWRLPGESTEKKTSQNKSEHDSLRR